MRWIAAIVAAFAASCAAPSRPSQPPIDARVRSSPNILLVTIDTLRADRVNAQLTPALARLAARGVSFTQARSVAPLTLPAHASIMTGRLPPGHGVRVNGAVLEPGPNTTLAARLQARGYRTGAVVGAFVLDRRFGLADGFDDYDDQVSRDPKAVDLLSADRPAALVIDRALAWLQRADSRPWFLWAHLYDPHAPYRAPGEERISASAAERYDDEVRYVDRELSRLLDHVEKRGVATAIVVVGDHGESLGEHGEPTHGMLLFDSALRVPFIVLAPEHPAAQRTDPASIVDVMPTLLAIAGDTMNSSLDGRNVLAEADPEREIYGETDYPVSAGWSAARSLVQGRFKVMSSGRSRLFDVTNDGAESADLAASRAALAAAMSNRVATLEQLASTFAGDASRTSSGRQSARPPDPEVAARLRALGYVSTGITSRDGSEMPVRSDAVDHIAQWAEFERALGAEQSGDVQAALQTVTRLVRAAPDALIFHSTHARLLSATGRHRDAVAAYKRLVARWATDASLFHDLAVAARHAGDASEAMRAERAALTIDEDFPAAHNGLGLVFADAERHQDARDSFVTAARLDPTNASYAANLGNAERALGRLDAAAVAYRQALAHDSSLADAANGLGVVLVQQKRPAHAIAFFEQAIKSDATFLEPQLNLAIALHESGQIQRALAQYRLVERRAAPQSREHLAARDLRRTIEAR